MNNQISGQEIQDAATALLSKEEVDKKFAVITAAIKQLSKKVDKQVKPKVTSTTKRMIVIGIMTSGIIVSVGWASGVINAKDALIILSGIMNGGFALIKT